MKLSIKAMAITFGLLWGAAMLIVSTINMFSPDYAKDFLNIVASVYPGYEAGEGLKSVIIGTLYAVFDAAIGGAIFAWVYNFFVK